MKLYSFISNWCVSVSESYPTYSVLLSVVFNIQILLHVFNNYFELEKFPDLQLVSIIVYWDIRMHDPCSYRGGVHAYELPCITNRNWKCLSGSVISSIHKSPLANKNARSRQLICATQGHHFLLTPYVQVPRQSVFTPFRVTFAFNRWRLKRRRTLSNR